MIDVLYLCHGRLEFTKASLPALLQNTDWSRVNQFVVYNDAPPDHPATYKYLRKVAEEVGEVMTLRDKNLGSPVGVMNHFLGRSEAKLFAKIDNDIVVPEGWLDVLAGVMERNPELELLGMEPGMSGVQPTDDPLANPIYDYLPSSHIGGVGLMRRSAFQRLPPLVPDGRFGFTEWQHEYEPVRGWVQPDLRMFALDQLPFEPWLSLTSRYVKKGLNREWGIYSRKMSYYWEWFA